MRELDELSDVPEFIHEVPRQKKKDDSSGIEQSQDTNEPEDLNSFHGQRKILSRRAASDQGHPQSIRPVLLHGVDGIDHISFGLRHFLSRGISHQSVQVDRVEGKLVRQLQPHRDHTSHPEEEDVVACLQHTCWVEPLQLLR